MKYTSVSPESAGISSDIIRECIEKLDADLVPIHSLLIMRHGVIAAEAYWNPWTRDRQHRMYSCTKSFVSIAIGCLYAEGRISLDDPIVSYFPEYEAERIHDERLEKTTIRDMLMMASCHRRTAYKEGSSSWSYVKSFSGHDWVKPFFTVQPDHDPGNLFIYDTSATQVLAALAEKLSGMDVLSYLKKNFLTDPDFFRNAYIIKEPGGVSAAGSGLVCRPVDMLYAIDRLMHFSGEGLLGEYIAEAVSKQIDTALGSRAGLADTASGYGYQIWMNTHGYMFYGMGAQLVMAIPDKDMAVVVTGDTQGVPNAEGSIFDAVWKIVDSAEDQPLPENAESFGQLQDTVSRLSMRVAPGSDFSALSQKINGKEYLFDSNSIGIKSLSVSFSDGTGKLRFSIEDEDFLVGFGLGYNKESYAELPFPVKSLSSAGWQTDSVLGILTEYIGDECGSLVIQISFSGNKATVYMRQCGELSIRPINGVATGSSR